SLVIEQLDKLSARFSQSFECILRRSEHLLRYGIAWLVNQVLVEPPLLVNGNLTRGFSHGISDDVFAYAEKVGLYAAYQVLQLPTPHVVIERQYGNLIDILTVVFGAPVFLPDPVQKLVAVFLIDHGQPGRAAGSDFPYDVIPGHSQYALNGKNPRR